FRAVAEPLLQDRCVTCGAVFDLRVDSDILKALPAVTVKSHAIVCVGANLSLLDPEFLSGKVSYALPEASLFLGLGSDAVAWNYFGDKRHDVIVSEPSQSGGLAGDAVKIFEYEVTGATRDWWAVHTSVTK